MIKKVNPLAVMRQGEEVVTDVTRSPFGIFIVFAAGAAFLAGFALIELLMIPDLLSNDTGSQQMAVGLVLFIIAAMFVTFFLFVVNKIYWDNYWVVTDDSITQVIRSSLFDKQASQMSLDNLEDVTAEQHGVLARIFNYGNISAETAGAKDKFLLTYCPHPDTYAKQILAAHENFLHGGGHSKEPDSDTGNDVTPPNVDSYEVPMGDD